LSTTSAPAAGGWLYTTQSCPYNGMQLEVANLFSGELIGRNVRMSGELDDGGQVRLDGSRGVVAQAEVVQEALAQRGHGSIPCRRSVREK
jgi:hypothetical protein